jgi:hypothetical protein
VKRILLAIAFVLIAGCASGRPPMPDFGTVIGEDCGKKCLRGHTWCMDATCPAKATSSCGPERDQKLRDCYEACLEGERAPGIPLRDPSVKR